MTVEDWLEAPPPPPTRGDCEDGPRPCPALRCKHHLGRFGEAAGHSCVLDVADLPADEAAGCENEPGARQTLVTIARILDVTRERVIAVRDNAKSRVRAVDEETLRALGVRRRRP